MKIEIGGQLQAGSQATSLTKALIAVKGEARRVISLAEMLVHPTPDDSTSHGGGLN